MRSEARLDLLVIGAHPDDAELCVGGILIKVAAMGYRTGVVDVTAGEMGTRGNRELRARESEQAAERLNLSIRENLDLGDAHVWPNEETRTEVVRMLRRLRPRVVLTHYWDDPHPDHVHTAEIVRQAAHVSGLVRYDAESQQGRWRPMGLAHFLFPRTVAPTFIVDISEVVEQKMAAVACHASQFFNPQTQEPETRVSTRRFLDEIEARDRYFGALIGATHGEALFVREALNVPDPVALLARTMNMYS